MYTDNVKNDTNRNGGFGRYDNRFSGYIDNDGSYIGSLSVQSKVLFMVFVEQTKKTVKSLLLESEG